MPRRPTRALKLTTSASSRATFDPPGNLSVGLQFRADLWHPEQRGYLLSYDGNDKLAATVADFRSADSLGTYELTGFRSSSTANNQTLFASHDIGTDTSFLHIYVAITTGKIRMNTQNAAGTSNIVEGSSNICDGSRKTIHVKSSGTAWSISVNGVPETLSVIQGANTGDWFADVTLRDNIVIGARTNSSSTGAYAIAEMAQHRIYSRELSDAECATNHARGWKAPASDTTGLVFDLPCTEGTSNPVDTVGAITMTVTGATWVEGLVDRSTNALALTSFASPTWGNTGRTFNGTSQYITDGALNITGDMTIAAWVKPTDVTITQIKASKSGSTISSVQYELDIASSTARIRGANGTSVFSATQAILSGIWQLVIGTFTVSSGLFSVSVNNVVGTDATLTGTKSTTTANFVIGARTPSALNLFFGGIIGEVIVWNRALYLTEQTQLRSATRSRYGV